MKDERTERALTTLTKDIGSSVILVLRDLSLLFSMGSFTHTVFINSDTNTSARLVNKFSLKKNPTSYQKLVSGG